MPPTYALRQFEGNPRFILSKKKTSSAVTFGLLLGFAAVTLLLVPLIFPQLKLHTFENYTVSGTVASPTEANGLTYPECYLFTRWLIENYGLDAVLLCCSGYDFERYFSGSFEQVFSAFLQSI